MHLNYQRSFAQGTTNQTALSFEMVQSFIAEISYQNEIDLKTTLCIIVLKNGYKIISKHQCAETESYDLELTQKFAYFKAMQEVCKAAHLIMLEQRYQNTQK